ncbi:MAG: hypothetical protein COB37_08580 [Kordiimonadales bacterium]|nr:MAG: hypothetical protein COB37_08580 [Kordiimonadales bacterium]
MFDQDTGNTNELALSLQFEQSVMAAIDRLGSTADELETAAADMNHATEATSVGVNAASSKVHNASDSVNAVAGATEEVSASVASVSQQMERAAGVTKNAMTEADDASRLMETLSESGKKISAVIKLIDNIASQTNLLALNATIEAARAGDAGRGFAVVAGEVKTLATQTSNATKEISKQIAELQSATGAAVTAFEKISARIGEIDTIANDVSNTVSQQAAATQEISHSAIQAAEGTQGVISDFNDMNEANERSMAASRQVTETVGSLQSQGGALRDTVKQFIEHLNKSE